MSGLQDLVAWTGELEDPHRPGLEQTSGMLRVDASTDVPSEPGAERSRCSAATALMAAPAATPTNPDAAIRRSLLVADVTG
jgi:hypothetical protein